MNERERKIYQRIKELEAQGVYGIIDVKGLRTNALPNVKMPDLPTPTPSIPEYEWPESQTPNEDAVRVKPQRERRGRTDYPDKPGEYDWHGDF